MTSSHHTHNTQYRNTKGSCFLRLLGGLFYKSFQTLPPTFPSLYIIVLPPKSHPPTGLLIISNPIPIPGQTKHGLSSDSTLKTILFHQTHLSDAPFFAPCRPESSHPTQQSCSELHSHCSSCSHRIKSLC